MSGDDDDYAQRRVECRQIGTSVNERPVRKLPGLQRLHSADDVAVS